MSLEPLKEGVWQSFHTDPHDRYDWKTPRVSMEVIVTSDSKLVYNLFSGLTTYLYRGYNPLTKYHGHPSRVKFQWEIIATTRSPNVRCIYLHSLNLNSIGQSGLTRYALQLPVYMRRCHPNFPVLTFTPCVTTPSTSSTTMSEGSAGPCSAS